MPGVSSLALQFAIVVLSIFLVGWQAQQLERATHIAAHPLPRPDAHSGRPSAVRYVSPAGKDTNDGSAKHPWATFQRADIAAGPGDTVIVMDGTYHGDVTLAASGTRGHPITYMAQHKWKAKLVG